MVFHIIPLICYAIEDECKAWAVDKKKNFWELSGSGSKIDGSWWKPQWLTRGGGGGGGDVCVFAKLKKLNT